MAWSTLDENRWVQAGNDRFGWLGATDIDGHNRPRGTALQALQAQAFFVPSVEAGRCEVHSWSHQLCITKHCQPLHQPLLAIANHSSVKQPGSTPQLGTFRVSAAIAAGVRG